MDDTSRRVADTEAPGGRAAETGRAVTADTDPATDRRTTEIRLEIEQTRDELSETIDAIQDKLRPRNIVANATEQLKSATTEKVRAMADTAGETAHDVMDQTREAAGGLVATVKQNPIPAALIGVGAAWLLMHRQPQQSRYTSSASVPAGRRYGYAADDYRYSAYKEDDRQSGFMDRVRSNPIPAALAGVGLGWLAFSQTGDRRSVLTGDDEDETFNYGYRPSRQPASESLTGDVSEAASRISEKVGRIGSRAEEYVEDTAQSVRRSGRRTTSQLQRMVRDNPLVVGAGALILGAAVGLAIPETERENELMGDARDTVVERAQEMARNAASEVKNAAGQMAGDVVSHVVSGKNG
jgi:ElaB/YqjD/DUF883 family membrane-anchored ribosome-binding protein